MTSAVDSLFSLFRLWSEEQVDLPALRLQLQGLAGLEPGDRALATALFDLIEAPTAGSARAFASQPDWLERHRSSWEGLETFRVRLARLLTSAAAGVYAQAPLAENLNTQALTLDPELAVAWLSRALLRMQMQAWQQALDDFALSRRLRPDWLSGWLDAARILMILGRPREGLALIDQALEVQSLQSDLTAQADLWLIRGNLFQALEDLDSAEAAYRRALELIPDHLIPDQAGIWFNLAQLLQPRQPAEALRCYIRYSELIPDQAEIWYRLGSLQFRFDQLAEAEASLGRCLQLMPGHYSAWVCRGLLAAQRSQPELAEQFFARARALDPQRPEAWLEPAFIQLNLGQEQGATALMTQSLEQVGHPGARAMIQMSLGRMLVMQHQPEAGDALMQAALAAMPDRRFWRFVREIGSPAAMIARPLAERRAYLSRLEALLPHWAGEPFAASTYLAESSFLPLDTLWGLMYIDDGPLQKIRSLYGKCFLPAAERPPARRGRGPLRLGVVVTSGHEGIFRLSLDRLLGALPASCCELLLLGNNPAALAPSGLRCLPLAHSQREAAQQLRALELEMIYYWECGSDPMNMLLPYFQPAPVQFTSWGLPMTSGLPVMDYYISSNRLEAADAQEHYSETLLLMENQPVCNTPPLPLWEHRSRTLFGLPEGVPLYVSLQNPLKYSPEFVDLLERLLRADPDGHLVLLESRQPSVRQAMSPLLDRLRPFGPRLHLGSGPLQIDHYRNLLALADVALDPLLYSGGQTSNDALFLGVPVVTLPGQAQHSRLTLSRYRQLGYEAAVATGPDDYLRLALELGNDRQKRDQVRAEILDHQPNLLSLMAVEEFAELLWEMARREGLR
ncbi:MAG: tetratricopeptide repeat protein [Candidatus Sericytochromatia bacterium]